MRKTLSAEEMPLYKVFSEEYLFTIPTVQRPYSWTTEEAEELLDDLVDYIEHQSLSKDISNYTEPYFLGSIVIVKKEGNIYEVLDGQQRLTTLTILLAVLRDYLGGEYAETIKKMIVQAGNFLLKTDDHYRIQLRKRDQDFFQQYIQKDKATSALTTETKFKTDSQRLIRDNALKFIEKINGADEEIIKTLPGVIYSLCYMVVVSTQNFDSAFRIFTVLNDRGLDLMASDIIKARAIGDVAQEEQDIYTQKWEEAEVALGRDRFNKLFEHIRMIVQKRKGGANLKDEYEAILSTMNGKYFIDEILLPYTEIYEKIINYQAHFQDYPSMIKILSLLNRIDNADWITIAMYYMYHKYEHNMEQFLYRLETFAATSMILQRNYNWRMSRYSQVLREMESGIDVFSEFSTLEIPNSDRVRLKELLNEDVYINFKDSAKRYVLLRLDSLLTKGQPYYNHSIITVEHVLPQNPKEGSQWLHDFPNPDEYVHKLGNLVLLTRKKNSKAKNFDFHKKKESYFQTSSGVTSFAITSQVMQENNWTPDVINSRQSKLIQLLTDTWGLNKKVSNTANNKFYLETTRGISGSGYPVDDQEFLVEEGSLFSQTINDSITSGNVKLRERLINTGVLQKRDDFYELKESYIFPTPSTAASMLIGRRTNGLTAWRRPDGKTLKEVKNS